LQATLDLTFEEAVFGVDKDVEIIRLETCEDCHGTRMRDGQTPPRCATCGGTGEVRGQECPTCDGTGFVRRTKTLEVNIPAGIDTGKRVRMAGQGGPGLNGGPAGDVNLVITVRPDRRFTREGDDLRTDVDVPVTTAVLGGEVEVTTPTGRVALKIPADTQSGRSFRLRGQGMPKLRARGGERGDLLARARIVTPTGISERERELYEELRALRPEGQS
jgi:DnaJ-class molecular chaperone